MKSVNPKIQLTLLGVVIATPFLVIASVVGAHITSLADNVRVDVLCVTLASVSIAVKVLEGHFALRSKTEKAERGDVETKGSTDMRGKSSIGLSW
jgi:hypothetical protein